MDISASLRVNIFPPLVFVLSSWQLPVENFTLPLVRPGEKETYSRAGKSSNRPLLPGGFEEEVSEMEAWKKKAPDEALNGEWLKEVMHLEKPLLDCPPELKNGFHFPPPESPAAASRKFSVEERAPVSTEEATQKPVML